MYEFLLLSLITVSLRAWKFIGLGVILAPLHGGISNIGTFIYSIVLMSLPPLISISAFLLLCFAPNYPKNKVNDLPIIMRAKEKSIRPAKERFRGFSTCLLPLSSKDYNNKLLNSCSSYSLFNHFGADFSNRVRKLILPAKTYSPKLKAMIDGEFSKMYKDLEN
jgi:hypothetical protein